MHTFWFIIYNLLAVPLMWIVIHTAGLFNRKAKRWIRGRKDLIRRVQLALGTDGLDSRLPLRTSAQADNRDRVWFHSSSAGEFEQAKPIIELLKQRSSEIEIIVSFFSPSGYENTSGYRLADHVTYMPFDSHFQAKRFVEIVRPKVVVFMRYDLWPNHVWQLAKRKTPMFLVDATAGNSARRRNPVVRSFLRQCYNAVDHILAVTASDAEGFRRFLTTHPVVEVAGDTRYDRVHAKSREALKAAILPDHVLRGKKVFIVGSSWDSDEMNLFPVFYRLQETEPNLLMILVPHEPSEQNLDRIETELKRRSSAIRFSALRNYSGERVIIVDCVGILLSLYASAHIAYVGGGFRPGVHNVLEPATYGIPVLFGPKIDNSQEAQELAGRGGGFVVRNRRNLYRRLRELLGNETKRRTAGDAALKLVEENIGATAKIVSCIEKAL